MFRMSFLSSERSENGVHTEIEGAMSGGGNALSNIRTTQTSEEYNSSKKPSEYGSTIKSLYRTIRRLWSSDKEFENSLQKSRSAKKVESRILLDLALHTLEVSSEDPSITLPLDYGILPPHHLLATPAYLRHTESFSMGPPLDDARCYIVDTVMQSIRMNLLCQTQKEHLAVEVTGVLNHSGSGSGGVDGGASSSKLGPNANANANINAYANTNSTANVNASSNSFISSQPASATAGHDPSASASFTASDLVEAAHGGSSSSQTGLRILVFGPQSLMRARRIVSSGDPLLPETYSALTLHGKIFNSGVYWTDDLSVISEVEPNTFDAVLWFDSMLPLSQVAKLHADALAKVLDLEKAIVSSPTSDKVAELQLTFAQAHAKANEMVADAQRQRMSSIISALSNVVKPGGTIAGTALFSKGSFATQQGSLLNGDERRIEEATTQGDSLVLTTESVFSSLCPVNDALTSFLQAGCDIQVFTDLALEGRIVVHHPSQRPANDQLALQQQQQQQSVDNTASTTNSGEGEVRPSPYAEFQTALLRSGRVQATRMLATKPLDELFERNKFQKVQKEQLSSSEQIKLSDLSLVSISASTVSPRHACILSIAFPHDGAVSSIAVPHPETVNTTSVATPTPIAETPEEADDKMLAEAEAVDVSAAAAAAQRNQKVELRNQDSSSHSIKATGVNVEDSKHSRVSKPVNATASNATPAAIASQPIVPIATRPRGLSASVSSPNLAKLLSEEGDNYEEDLESNESKHPTDVKEPATEQLDSPIVEDPVERITASGSRMITTNVQRHSRMVDMEFLPPPLTHVLSNTHSMAESQDPFAPVTIAPPYTHPAATPVPHELAAATAMSMFEAQAAVAAAESIEPLRYVRRDRLAVSGVSIGLPNDDSLSEVVSGFGDVSVPVKGRSAFDKDNLHALFRGENFLQRLDDDERREIVSKNPFMLLTKDGKRVKKYLTAKEQLIGVKGKLGKLDLVREYGVPPFVIEALDITFQFAIAAGLEALQDAGIQVMGKDGQGRPVVVPLARNVAEDTGIIFASSFPGMDSCVEETTAAVAYQTKMEIVNMLKSRHEAELAQKCAIENAKAEASSNPEDTRNIETPYSIALKELESTTMGPLYEYNRKLLFRVLVMANAQLAELIKARGPNTHVNAACAGTSQAIAMAEDWIRIGRCSRVVVVSADTATSDRLFPYIGTGFLVLGAASIVQDPMEAAAPFDIRRKGMIVGAGAVGLVIEKYSSVRMRHLEMVQKARRFEKSKSLVATQIIPTNADGNVAAVPKPHGVLTVEEALAWKPKAELLGSVIRNSAFHASLIDGDHVSSEMHQFMTLMEQIHGKRLFGADLAPNPAAYWEDASKRLANAEGNIMPGNIGFDDYDDDEDSVDEDSKDDEVDRLAWMHALPANMPEETAKAMLSQAESAFEHDPITFVAPKPSSTQGASQDDIKAILTPFETLPPIRQLRRSRIAQQLMYIAHETGTAACAKVESRAVHDSFGNRFKQQVIFTGTKGYTGHPMSVAFEDVVAVAALHFEKAPPVANLRNLDPALGKIQLSKGGSHNKNLTLRFAAGFGSQFAILLFRKFLAPLNESSGANNNTPKYLPGLGEIDLVLEAQDYDEVPSELVESLSARAAKAAQRARRKTSPVGPPGSAAQALRVYQPSFSAGSPFHLYAKSGVAWVPLVSTRSSSTIVGPSSGSGLSSPSSSFASGQFGFGNPFLPQSGGGSSGSSFGISTPDGMGAYYPYAGGQAGMTYGYGSIAGSIAGSVSSMSNAPTSPTASGSAAAVEYTPTNDPLPTPIVSVHSNESSFAGNGASPSARNPSASTIGVLQRGGRGAFRHMDM